MQASVNSVATEQQATSNQYITYCTYGEYTKYDKYISSNNKPTNQTNLLKTKAQLNKLVVTSDNKPDHLAINIYWDTLRSWYTPRIAGVSNTRGTARLKTKGVFLNYNKLSQVHGVSQETIRKKLVKLEKLGLIQRSFQHKETITTKSFNQLIVYVWQQTPHFFNPYGIDQNDVKELFPQTNYKYISEKYNVDFASQSPNTSKLLVDGGIHQADDTKELIKPFSKEKDRSTESNFCKSFFEEKFEQPTSQSVSNGFDEGKVEAKQIKGIFAKAKELKDFYPLTKEDCQNLRSSSRREFSLNAMNEILLDMSKRLTDRVFSSKKAFLSYMSKAFTYEMRDAVKTGNEDFKINNNKTCKDITLEEQEKYLTEIEYNLQVSPEWHLKKKLACVFDTGKSYELLRAYRSIAQEGSVFTLLLDRYVELTKADRDIILAQVKATHEIINLGANEITMIESLKIKMPEKSAFEDRESRAQNSKTRPLSATIPDTIWGRVRRSLITVYGEALDGHWLSKLEVKVDEDSKTIELKAPSEFIYDWVKSNYLGLIEQASGTERYQVSFV